jgi:asparagine synthase (glutamine-hydrolysing)
MSGITGGNVSDESVREMTDTVVGLEEESTWISTDTTGGLGVSYPSRDPGGVATWEDGSKAGIVYGAVTNLSELGISYEDVFERLLERPAETATALEGGFLAACRDRSEDRYVLAADKLGSRAAFYSTEGPFRFGTSVSAILDQMRDPTLDLEGVSNMILMGHLWGSCTLVDEITAVRPAHVVEVSDGTITTERYWRPDYREADPGPDYTTELVERYRRAVRRGRQTFSGEVGIWLSGGLDSRSTSAALMEGDGMGDATLNAYTYDANSPLGINPQLAEEVAGKLGIGFREVSLDAETFGDVFERAIETVDGMIAWNTLCNISATYGVDDRPSIMIEGMQGELLGDHLLRSHLEDYSSAVESQFASEASVPTEAVTRILQPDVDPLTTFRDEAERSPEYTTPSKIKDIHFQNYYSRKTLASNRIIRDRFGERTLHADGEYLEWCAKLPRTHRKGSVPWGNTDIPYGTTRAKLELMRRLSPTLSDITYERTRMKPSLPYPVHVLGFFSSVTLERLLSRPTYGGGQLADFWVRDRGSPMHGIVSNLIEDARDRPLFDGDAVVEVYDAHMDGDNNIPMLSRITTLEYWLQEHLD